MARYTEDELLDRFKTTQAALRAVSGDRLLLDEPTQTNDGRVILTVSPKPRGASQWRAESDQQVDLALATRGGLEVRVRVGFEEPSDPVNEHTAASSLGVSLATWRQTLNYLETGIKAANLGDPSEDPELQAAIVEIEHFVAQAHERERLALNTVATGITATQNPPRVVFRQGAVGQPELEIRPYTLPGTRGPALRVVATHGAADYPAGISLTMEATSPHVPTRCTTTSDLWQALDEVNGQIATWNAPRPDPGHFAPHVSADLHRDEVSGPGL